MPFKSEKQRKYLWANEPEIARDWTDTYGSGIHKAKGGRIGFARGRTDSYAGDHTSKTADYGYGAGRTTPDRSDDHGQFQRRIAHTKTNKEMAAREGEGSGGIKNLRDFNQNIQHKGNLSVIRKKICLLYTSPSPRD